MSTDYRPTNSSMDQLRSAMKQSSCPTTPSPQTTIASSFPPSTIAPPTSTFLPRSTSTGSITRPQTAPSPSNSLSPTMSGVLGVPPPAMQLHSLFNHHHNAPGAFPNNVASSGYTPKESPPIPPYPIPSYY